jgi:hypothetical protein
MKYPIFFASGWYRAEEKYWSPGFTHVLGVGDYSRRKRWIQAFKRSKASVNKLGDIRDQFLKHMEDG